MSNPCCVNCARPRPGCCCCGCSRASATGVAALVFAVMIFGGAINVRLGWSVISYGLYTYPYITPQGLYGSWGLLGYVFILWILDLCLTPLLGCTACAATPASKPFAIAGAALSGFSLLFTTVWLGVGTSSQINYFAASCASPACVRYGDAQMAFAVLLLLSHCAIVVMGCKLDKIASVQPSPNASAGDIQMAAVVAQGPPAQAQGADPAAKGHGGEQQQGQQPEPQAYVAVAVAEPAQAAAPR